MVRSLLAFGKVYTEGKLQGEFDIDNIDLVADMEYERGDPFGGIDVSSPTGRRLDPENENDADDFRNNLEQLGSRFHLQLKLF